MSRCAARTTPRARIALTTLLTGLLLHSAPAPLAAQDPVAAGSPVTTDPELVRLLEGHRYAMTGTLAEPAGPGFELLVREGLAADFFLIGENHMTAEIPTLTGLLLRRLAPRYEAFAVETGPHTAAWLVERVAGGGVSALREVAVRYPFTVPFFEQAPEAALLEVALENGYQVWGLDQEFMGSGRYWLDRLAERAPDAGARALVDGWREREAEALRLFQQTGNTEGALLMAAAPADFDALAEAFRGDADALAIIDALRTSAHIYQLWNTQNYENNRERVTYLRANLVAQLHGYQRETGEAARVFLKFGSYHTGRGFSPVNQLDLGNLAHNLATLRGGRSVNVWTVAVSAQQPDGTLVQVGEQSPVVRVLAEHATEGPWTVFDARALRPWFHRERNRARYPELADAVFQHDFIALARRFTPSEPLVPAGG
ncbi:MAG: hypothetical protein RQ751_04240 [Longimicrobiales bacterium]|nr:hypothetical protein [Longimicrobiales bacterium]